MLISTVSLTLLVTLNLVFAAAALTIGFVAGVWLGGTRRRQDSGIDASDLAEQERQKQLERERIALATSRLRDLAGAVAADIGEHSACVSEISHDLRALDTTNVEVTGAGIVDALAKIVAANEALQQKLTKAEEQIAAQAREIHLHESEARTDSLTGLANRRAFDDEMKRRYAEARRKGVALSLLLMDIDHFKQFNDTHGHQAGDEVLRAVGRELVRTCRDMDLPCRYGGEEFAVVMPATTAAEGTAAAERIRIAVEKMSVEFEGKVLTVTTSVGLAQLGPQDDISRVLKRADEALYASKRAGRNCGHHHDGASCVAFTPRILEERKQARKKVAEQQDTELLDSLPNRTKFFDELRRRLAESSRTEQPIAVLVFALRSHDELRSQMGAEVASAALNAVAALVGESLREMDLLAHLSENRFACLLPGSNRESAATVGGRVKEAFAQCPLVIGDESIALDVEFGVTDYLTGDTAEVLVGRAEQDLSNAKTDLVAN